MAAPRFYVSLSATKLDEAMADKTEVMLPAKAAHHAGRALRLRTGEEVVLYVWAQVVSGEARFALSTKGHL